MVKKICIISDLHLSSNPRVWKEANTLAYAGYDVVILTIWTSAEKRERDVEILQNSSIVYKAALNLIQGEILEIKRFLLRLRSRLSREIKRWIGIESAWCLGYAPGIMLRAAFAEKADLYIAHTEFGIVIGKELILKGAKVAYDIEDWYSKDYLVPERPVKLLQLLEGFALKNGVYCSCPSHSMAEALAKTYPSGKKTEVLYNGFSQKENADVKSIQSGSRSLVWFSQTIGEGRGLETVIKAISRLSQKTVLHLIGESVKGYDEQLKLQFPFEKGHELIIHPPVKHYELVSVLSKFSIGLAIENQYPESRNQTVTNKILQYLQAGIKILATDTKGQSEVANYFPGSIAIVPVNDQENWAEQIEKLFSLPQINRAEQLNKFNELFSWEAQEQKLLQLVNTAIND